MEEKKGFIGIQNWLGKLILMVLGTIWLTSDIYDNVMYNFFLTDREVAPWGTMGDWGVLLAAGGLIAGGVWLNKLLSYLPSRK